MTPYLVLVAVLGGLAVVLAATPIVARGDYGQWLMSSRYYLGEPVPDYRTITALPPAIPLFLAGVQTVLSEPVAALQAANVLLMAGLAASFFLVGAALGRSALTGTATVAIGLLVTDRYLELFAFGGLLQSGSVMFTAFSVAAFVQAGQGPELRLRWWVVGSAALACAALSHVGAGTVAVPVGLAAAGLAAVRLRHLGWRTLRHALVPVMAGLAAIGLYWLFVLLPASQEYVTNPASLGYRGPERLFRSLADYPPTAGVVLIGMATVVVGSVAELRRGLVDQYVYLLAWTALTWGSFVAAVVLGASTDYPRFAPVLLAPLVPACALALLGAARWAASRVPRLRATATPVAWMTVAVAAVVIVAVPFAVSRFGRQAATYQPRNAEALTAAVMWVDEALSDPDLAVLTAVRDGKWLEGLTGREALFSLPVRYAFRPSEWQRSVDADALFRSTAALTNEYFFVKWIAQAPTPEGPVPTSLLLGVNHGGEYVELLRVAPADTRILSADGSASVATLTPMRAVETATTTDVALRTDWHGVVGTAAVDVVRQVRLWRDGATMWLTDRTTGTGIQTVVRPPLGMAFTTLEIVDREAQACFTRIGARNPCVRIVASQPDATIEATTDGGIRVETHGSTELDLLVTALTASGSSVGLGVLDPEQLVTSHEIGAVLALRTDPSFAFRRDRLEGLGFEQVRTFGPYAVMIREEMR